MAGSESEEISLGCDGVDESIISCLSGLSAKGKKICPSCQNALDVTKGFVRKLNTMPSTVISMNPLNATHMSQVETTRNRDVSTSPSSWTCPPSFLRESSNGCCGAPLDTPSNAQGLCAITGGRWNLVALDDGPFFGMRCCPPTSSVTSHMLTHRKTTTVEKKKAYSPLMRGVLTESDPFMYAERELGGRSLVMIISFFLLIGYVLRQYPERAAELARQLGIPTQKFSRTKSLATYSHVPTGIEIISNPKKNNEYGTI